MKEEKRIIPNKNYIKLAIIFVVTISVVVFTYVMYNSQKEYENNIPVIRGSIAELNEQDLNNYFIGNDDFLLYIGVANDENCRELEEDLIELLKERRISNAVYLNITDVINKNEFYNVFNSNYSLNEKLNSYPAFLVVSDKKVVDLVQRKDKKLAIENIEQLLDEYEITGDKQ
ncbi:MAG: hypothetical protein J6A52_05695 [Bacilli bacterium]|nr:hypothetical protein [Bacilli bacterium]